MPSRRKEVVAVALIMLALSLYVLWSMTSRLR